MKAVPDNGSAGDVKAIERDAFVRGLAWHVILPAAVSVAAILIVRYLISSFGVSLILPTVTYLALHSTIEILTVTISAAIFMLGWYSYRSTGNVRNLLLAAAFLYVALVDLMHTLSYEGMPRFISENGVSKAIYYWLAARFVQVLALFAVSVMPKRRDGRLKKPLFLSLALGAAALTFVAVTFAQDSFPEVFEPGIGLTGFKIAAEYLIMAMGAVALAAMARTQRREASVETWSLLSGVTLFVFSEFAFTEYASPFDPNNLLGHLLKLGSMAFLFRALIQSGIERPYSSLESSEKKSREALDRFTALFESAPDAVFVADVESGILVDCNRNAVKLIGRPKEAIVGTLAADLHPPDKRESTMRGFAKHGAGELLFVDTEVLTASGKRVPVEIFSSVVEHDGERYLIGTFRDVTERRVIEEELRKSNDQFSTLAAIAPVGIYLTDADGNCLYANPAWCEMAGFGMEDALGMGWVKALHPEDKEAVFNGWKRMVESRGKWGQEYRFRTPGGKVTNIFGLAAPQTDESGKIIRYVGVNLDITERKRSEAVLDERDERLRKLAVHVPGMIYQFVRKPEGGYYIPFTSDAIEQVFGVTADAVKDDAAPIFGAIVAEDVDRVRESIEESARKVSLWQCEFRVRTGDGPVRWLLAQSNPERLPDGTIVWHGFCTDITDRKEIEERDRRLDELKDQFVRLVSHQLRTPLSAVRWGLEEVMGGETASAKEMVRMAYEANGEVITRIGDMVVALEIERGRMRLEKREAFLEDIVSGACRAYAGRAETRGVKIVRDFPSKQRTSVPVDVERMSDVIRRLLDNAISYTERGGSVRLGLSVTGKSVRFTVADTGIGISDEAKPEMFTRFYRGANAMSMRPNASGLGLFIAKHIVKTHGGKIGFESEEGKGSTFWFEIPRNGK